MALFAVVWLVGTIIPTGKGGFKTASASSPAAGSQHAGISPKTIKIQYALALAEYYAGKYANAQRLFTGIADLVPGHLSDDIQFWRAECSFRLGNFKAAGTGFKLFLGQGAQGPRAEIASSRLSLLASWGG